MDEDIDKMFEDWGNEASTIVKVLNHPLNYFKNYNRRKYRVKNPKTKLISLEISIHQKW